MITILNKDSFAIAGTQGETVIKCSGQNINLNLVIVSKVQVTGIRFEECRVNVLASNSVQVLHSDFFDGSNGAIAVTSSSNVSIDHCNFKNNQATGPGTLAFRSTSGVEITLSNFTNNFVSAFQSIISFQGSDGFVSCSNFFNNSVSSNGGIVRSHSAGSNLVQITNSTFIANTVGPFAGVVLVDSNNDIVTIISTVLSFNTAGSSAGTVNVAGEGDITILGSEFSHNRAGAFGGGSIRVSGSNSEIVIDCTNFVNNSLSDDEGFRITSGNTLMQSNSSACRDLYAIPQTGHCEIQLNNYHAYYVLLFLDCRPPGIFIGLEFPDYVIDEGSEDTLQVCVLASRLPFEVEATLAAINGTAGGMSMKHSCLVYMLPLSPPTGSN